MVSQGYSKNEIQRQARVLIWVISKEMRYLYSDSDLNAYFMQSLKLKEMIFTIEWLSGIACDDWCDHENSFINFHNEINDRSILGIESLYLSSGWKNFCENIAKRANKPVHYGQYDINVIRSETFQDWKLLGLSEGWLVPNNGLLGRIYRNPVYTVEYPGLKRLDQRVV